MQSRRPLLLGIRTLGEWTWLFRGEVDRDRNHMNRYDHGGYCVFCRGINEIKKSSLKLLIEIYYWMKIFITRIDNIDMIIWSCLKYEDHNRKSEHRIKF